MKFNRVLARLARRQLILAPGTLLVDDAFIDADATPLASHAIAPINKLVLAWVSIAGTMITNGNYAIPSSAANAVFRVNPGVADVEITVDLVPLGTPTGFCGLCIRVDGTSWWDIGYTTGTKFAIYEKFTERASQAMSLANGQTYPLRVTALGPVISAWLNGVNLTYSSAVNQGITIHGIKSPSNAQAKLKNFRLSRL